MVLRTPIWCILMLLHPGSWWCTGLDESSLDFMCLKYDDGMEVDGGHSFSFSYRFVCWFGFCRFISAESTGTLQQVDPGLLRIDPIVLGITIELTGLIEGYNSCSTFVDDRSIIMTVECFSGLNKWESWLWYLKGQTVPWGLIIAIHYSQGGTVD